MHLAERVLVQTERDQLVHELGVLDDQLAELSAQRLALVARLRRTRELLYPPVPWSHGRRPPDLDTAPLPPIVDGAEPLIGRALRAACRAVLARHGATSLRDLHGLLHRYGYVVSARRPVAALSDAMRYEVEQGRARRIQRGVYELRTDGAQRRRARGDHPRTLAELQPGWRRHGSSPLDPVLDEDPSTWVADGGRDGPITNLATHDPP
jgi:hypothetical protein